MFKERADSFQKIHALYSDRIYAEEKLRLQKIADLKYKFPNEILRIIFLTKHRRFENDDLSYLLDTITAFGDTQYGLHMLSLYSYAIEHVLSNPSGNDEIKKTSAAFIAQLSDPAYLEKLYGQRPLERLVTVFNDASDCLRNNTAADTSITPYIAKQQLQDDIPKFNTDYIGQLEFLNWFIDHNNEHAPCKLHHDVIKAYKSEFSFFNFSPIINILENLDKAFATVYQQREERANHYKRFYSTSLSADLVAEKIGKPGLFSPDRWLYFLDGYEHVTHYYQIINLSIELNQGLGFKELLTKYEIIKSNTIIHQDDNFNDGTRFYNERFNNSVDADDKFDGHSIEGLKKYSNKDIKDVLLRNGKTKTLSVLDNQEHWYKIVNRDEIIKILLSCSAINKHSVKPFGLYSSKEYYFISANFVRPNVITHISNLALKQLCETLAIKEIHFDSNYQVYLDNPTSDSIKITHTVIIQQLPEQAEHWSILLHDQCLINLFDALESRLSKGQHKKFDDVVFELLKTHVNKNIIYPDNPQTAFNMLGLSISDCNQRDFLLFWRYKYDLFQSSLESCAKLLKKFLNLDSWDSIDIEDYLDYAGGANTQDVTDLLNKLKLLEDNSETIDKKQTATDCKKIYFSLLFSYQKAFCGYSYLLNNYDFSKHHAASASKDMIFSQDDINAALTLLDFSEIPKDRKVIESRYRQLSLKYHPDKQESSADKTAAFSKFDAIIKAKDLLINYLEAQWRNPTQAQAHGPVNSSISKKDQAVSAAASLSVPTNQPQLEKTLQQQCLEAKQNLKKAEEEFLQVNQAYSRILESIYKLEERIKNSNFDETKLEKELEKINAQKPIAEQQAKTADDNYKNAEKHYLELRSQLKKQSQNLAIEAPQAQFTSSSKPPVQQSYIVQIAYKLHQQYNILIDNIKLAEKSGNDVSLETAKQICFDTVRRILQSLSWIDQTIVHPEKTHIKQLIQVILKNYKIYTPNSITTNIQSHFSQTVNTVATEKSLFKNTLDIIKDKIGEEIDQKIIDIESISDITAKKNAFFNLLKEFYFYYDFILAIPANSLDPKEPTRHQINIGKLYTLGSNLELLTSLNQNATHTTTGAVTLVLGLSAPSATFDNPFAMLRPWPTNKQELTLLQALYNYAYQIEQQILLDKLGKLNKSIETLNKQFDRIKLIFQQATVIAAKQGISVYKATENIIDVMEDSENKKGLIKILKQIQPLATTLQTAATGNPIITLAAGSILTSTTLFGSSSMSGGLNRSQDTDAANMLLLTGSRNTPQ